MFLKNLKIELYHFLETKIYFLYYHPVKQPNNLIKKGKYTLARLGFGQPSLFPICFFKFCKRWKSGTLVNLNIKWINLFIQYSTNNLNMFCVPGISLVTGNAKVTVLQSLFLICWQSSRREKCGWSVVTGHTVGAVSHRGGQRQWGRLPRGSDRSAESWKKNP